MSDRRTFIKSVAAALSLAAMPACASKEARPKKVKILVVSGWQDINIGDIGHTPGLLNVLQTYIPNAEITLWKMRKGEEVEKMLGHYFPKVKIVHADVDKDYGVSSDEVKAAIDSADIFIHGSGPSVVARRCLSAWRKRTDKPYGIFGTTIESIDPSLAVILENASFIYTRETASIKAVRAAGIKNKVLKFVPDATFDMDIRDDAAAEAFLKERGLEERNFICVVPRLRRTPYWLSRKDVKYTEEKKKETIALNDKWKEIDHAKAREAIIRWVRVAKKPVLICPEMTYQVDIMDELLINPLPEDVKPFVQKRGYWFPDVAAGVYAKAYCVISFECHSPIMSLKNSTPAFYLRQPEDTIKGQMYYDLGYNKWVFEIQETTGQQIADRLMEVYANYPAALAYAKAGIEKADALFKEGAEYAEKVAIDSRRARGLD